MFTPLHDEELPEDIRVFVEPHDDDGPVEGLSPLHNPPPKADDALEEDSEDSNNS